MRWGHLNLPRGTKVWKAKIEPVQDTFNTHSPNDKETVTTEVAFK